MNCVYWSIEAICCWEDRGQTSYKFHKTYDNIIKSLKHLIIFLIIATGFNSSFILVWRGQKMCMFFFWKCILFLEIVLKSLKSNWLSPYRNSVVPIIQPWFPPHPCAPAEHPCCHWNCGTSLSWINLPGTSIGSVYEQDLHKRPIGSARPWLTPASERQLAHTYRSGRQRAKGARGGRRKPSASRPHMTISTHRHRIFWRHTLAEQWITSQMIWL